MLLALLITARAAPPAELAPEAHRVVGCTDRSLLARSGVDLMLNTRALSELPGMAAVPQDAPFWAAWQYDSPTKQHSAMLVQVLLPAPDGSLAEWAGWRSVGEPLPETSPSLRPYLAQALPDGVQGCMLALTPQSPTIGHQSQIHMAMALHASGRLRTVARPEDLRWWIPNSSIRYKWDPNTRQDLAGSAAPVEAERSPSTEAVPMIVVRANFSTNADTLLRWLLNPETRMYGGQSDILQDVLVEPGATAALFPHMDSSHRSVAVRFRLQDAADAVLIRSALFDVWWQKGLERLESQGAVGVRNPFMPESHRLWMATRDDWVVIAEREADVLQLLSPDVGEPWLPESEVPSAWTAGGLWEWTPGAMHTGATMHYTIQDGLGVTDRWQHVGPGLAEDGTQGAPAQLEATIAEGAELLRRGEIRAFLDRFVPPDQRWDYQRLLATPAAQAQVEAELMRVLPRAFTYAEQQYRPELSKGSSRVDIPLPRSMHGELEVLPFRYEDGVWYLGLSRMCAPRPE